MGAVPVTLRAFMGRISKLTREFTEGKLKPAAVPVELADMAGHVYDLARVLSDDDRKRTYDSCLRILGKALGDDPCWSVFLSPLCDVNVDIIDLWESLSSTSLTLPPPTRAAALEAAPTAGTRPLSYTDRKSRAETVTAQVHMFDERYNLATLEKTNDLFGWLEHMTTFITSAPAMMRPLDEWKSIVAEIVITHLKPVDINTEALEAIATEIKEAADKVAAGLQEGQTSAFAEIFWHRHVIPTLTGRLARLASFSHGHAHVGAIQGSSEAATSFINRFLVRVRAMQEIHKLIPRSKNLLAQMLDGLKPEVRGDLQRLLVQYQVTDLDGFMAKFEELNRTCFSTIDLYQAGEHVSAPVLIETEGANAIVKRPHRNEMVCWRCHQIGHWSRWCPAETVTLKTTGCGRCGADDHPLAKCSKTPKPCGRFGCQEQHPASRCPRVFTVTENGVPAPQPMKFSNKRQKQAANAAIVYSHLPEGALARPCEYVVVAFLSYIHAHYTVQRKLLGDGGATINILSADFVQKLMADPNMDLPKDAVKRLPIPTTVELANEQVEVVRNYITLPICINGRSFRIPFHIFPHGAKLILGRPAIELIWPHARISRDHRQLAVAATTAAPDMTLSTPPSPDAAPTCAESYITTKFVNGQKRLVCHLPMLENAKVFLTRERPRDHNPTVQKIIYEKIKQLEAEGKVSRARPSEVSYTSPLVLVDKHAEQKKPKRHPIPAADTGRWRLTLDNRGLNDLRVLASRDRIVLVPGKIKHEKTSTGAVSFAPTGRNILREFKVENCEYWAKTDMTNAFDHVLLADGLCHLFGADVFNPETSEWEVYIWRVLPQGWTFSPLLFRLAVDELKTITLNRLAATTSAAIPPQIKNLADDLLTGGADAELVSQAQGTLHAVLMEYGFPVNLAKCISASRDSTFCGAHLHGCLVQPTATRKPILASFAESAWEDLTTGNIDKLQWLRSIAGHFQFLKGHLSREMEEHLRIFYEAISALQRDSTVDIATAETREALEALVDYACNGLPQMVLARFPEVHATVIVVDASPRSWAATVFLLATVPEATAAQLPDTKAVVEQLRQSEHFRHRTLPPNIGLIPSFILADTFREQGPSSTWYERRAQIDAVHALYPLCEGPIYVVSDNANSGKKWHNVDEGFSGTAYARLQFFQSNVSGIIWQQRDNLPSISDALARVVEAYARPRPSGSDSPTSPNSLAATEGVAGPPSDLNPRRKPKRKQKTNRKSVRSHRTTATSPATAAAAISEQLPAGLDTFLALVKPQYTADTTLFQPGMPMSLVYSILTSTTPPSTKREHLAHRRFRLSTDGFVYLKSAAVGDRLYVPSFTTLALGEGARHSRGYLINHFHCENGPHLGTSRTEADLCRHFFWPRMRSDVARFVGACMTCHTLKATHRPATGTLSSVVAQANHPFDILLMDFASIPKTNDSFLLVMDAFTHYTFAFRTKDQTAETVKNVLTNLFTQLSAPNRIHCDRGAHFNADIIHELSRSVGFELTFSPTGNPRSQGAAENAVKSVKAMLCTTLHSRRAGDSLDLCLRTAVQVHNATAIVRLGLCPAEIMFGFRPKLPGMWPPESPAQDGPLSIPALDTIRHALRTVWRIRRDEYIARYQDQYFMEARESRIRPGDYVQYQPPLMAPGKTFPNPRGFFRVIKPAGSNTWYLSRDQWRPEAPLTDLTALAVGDIAPENHLVRFQFARDLRLGLDVPPPPPSSHTRAKTRATTRSSADL